MIHISVVIPTYNRIEILKRTLSALDGQTLKADKFEAIIIDDGSTDDTVSLIKKEKALHNFRISLLKQNHQGPAAARNKGIKVAQGEIVLIINDDTVPDSRLLEHHLTFHSKHTKGTDALLGKVTWHPAIKITPFMKWLENGGPYFSFNKIKGNLAGWQRLWTCNISFKKAFLLSYGLFDESFPDAAWEDVELGYRLSQSGLKLYYERKALGYHYHPTTIVSIRNKMMSNGRNLSIYCRKVPRKYWPPIATHTQQLFIFDKLLLTPMVSILGARPTINFINSMVLLHYRIKGYRETYSKQLTFNYS